MRIKGLEVQGIRKVVINKAGIWERIFITGNGKWSDCFKKGESVLPSEDMLYRIRMMIRWGAKVWVSGDTLNLSFREKPSNVKELMSQVKQDAMVSPYIPITGSGNR